MSFPGYLLLKMKIWFPVRVFAEIKSDERVAMDTDGSEILIKHSVTGMRMGIWRPFCSYSGHPIYIPVWNDVCVCACWLKSLLLCGRLPALSHIIADSVVYRGGGRMPDTAPPFGSLCTNTHIHTSSAEARKKKSLFNSQWTRAEWWMMEKEME